MSAHRVVTRSQWRYAERRGLSWGMDASKQTARCPPRHDEEGPGRMHDWIELLRSQTDRFAAVVEGGDLEAQVVHCPGWSLRDLADHLGGVHEWAAHAVVAGSPDLEPEPAGPLGPAAWPTGTGSTRRTWSTSSPPDPPTPQ